MGNQDLKTVRIFVGTKLVSHSTEGSSVAAAVGKLCKLGSYQCLNVVFLALEKD